MFMLLFLLSALVLVLAFFAAEYEEAQCSHVPQVVLKPREKEAAAALFLSEASSRLVGLETSLEQVRGILTQAGPHVLRFVGPSGSGKTSLSCFVRGALFEEAFPFDACVRGGAPWGPGALHMDLRQGDAVEQALSLALLAEKKLEMHQTLLLEVRGFAQASPAAQAVVNALLRRPALQKSVVLLLDEPLSRPKASTSPAAFLAEEKAHSPSLHHETWVALMPLSTRSTEQLLRRICRRTRPRLVCAQTALAQASILLEPAVQSKGGRALLVLEQAVQEMVADLESEAVVFDVDTKLGAVMEQNCTLQGIKPWIRLSPFVPDHVTTTT